MGEFFRGIGDWLASVIRHWEIIVVSGAIPFAIEMLEKLFNWKMPHRLYLIFVGIGLLLAMSASWQEEHAGKIDLDNKLQSTRTQFDRCDAERSSSTSLNNYYSAQLQSQQSFINSQQGTVDTCVVALAKNGVPLPLKMDALAGDIPGAVEKTTLIVGITNQRVQPVHVNVTCDTEATGIAGERIAGGGVQTDLYSYKKGRTIEVKIGSPAWTPTAPFILVVLGTVRACSIAPA